MGVFTHFYVGPFLRRFRRRPIWPCSSITIPGFIFSLIPALAMRLLAEEKPQRQHRAAAHPAVIPWCGRRCWGKYPGAAWAFAGLALALTFPIWLTVNYLGHPDNGVILASYVGSFLMAGAYLSIGAAISAATSNQAGVIAFCDQRGGVFPLHGGGRAAW